MRIVSWNMQNLRESWRFVVDRHQEFDFAFVQEACTPTKHVRDYAGHWDIPHERWQVRPKKYKQEVLSISGRWTFDRLDRDTISALGPAGEPLLAPRFRAAAVARNKTEGQEVCLVCAISGPKNSLKLANTVTAIRRTLKRARFDPQMQMIVAGDLTTDPERTPQTFADTEGLGMQHPGPTVPNYIQKSLGERPETAHRHLDHVFVSDEIADRVTATALNDPDENSAACWGPSDHCRILIEVAA